MVKVFRRWFLNVPLLSIFPYCLWLAIRAGASLSEGGKAAAVFVFFAGCSGE
jgi:hypothetical protein